MAIRRCRNSSNDLIHGGRWWWWWLFFLNILCLFWMADRLITGNDWCQKFGGIRTSGDSVITIVTRRYERSEFRVTVGWRSFIFLQIALTASGAHPVSYSVGTVLSSQGYSYIVLARYVLVAWRGTNLSQTNNNTARLDGILARLNPSLSLYICWQARVRRTGLFSRRSSLPGHLRDPTGRQCSSARRLSDPIRRLHLRADQTSDLARFEARHSRLDLRVYISRALSG